MLRMRTVFLIVFIILIGGVAASYQRFITIPLPAWAMPPVAPSMVWRGVYLTQPVHDAALAEAVQSMHLDVVFGPVSPTAPVGNTVIVSTTQHDTVVGRLVALKPASHTIFSGIEPALQLKAAGGMPIITTPRSGNTPWTGRLDGAAGIDIVGPLADRNRLGDIQIAMGWPAWMAQQLRPDMLAMQWYASHPDVLHLWDQIIDAPGLGMCPTLPPEHWGASQPMQKWMMAIQHPAYTDTHITLHDHIMQRLETRRWYCYAGFLSGDPQFDFVHENNVLRASVETGGNTEIQMRLLRNGVEMVRTHNNTLTYRAPQSGRYRVEVDVKIPNLLWGSRWETLLYSQRIDVPYTI